jgi:hypothetical protein
MSQSAQKLFNIEVIFQKICDDVPPGQLNHWKTISKFHKKEIEANLEITKRKGWAYYSPEDAYRRRLRIAKQTLPIFRDQQQETDLEAELYDKVDFSQGNATLEF